MLVDDIEAILAGYDDFEYDTNQDVTYEVCLCIMYVIVNNMLCYFHKQYDEDINQIGGFPYTSTPAVSRPIFPAALQPEPPILLPSPPQPPLDLPSVSQQDSDSDV